MATEHSVWDLQKESTIPVQRNPRNKQFHASLGLLAYASTFQEVSKQELGDEVAEGLPFFHDAGLERSLSALQAVNQLANDDAARRRGVMQNIILWVVGVMISVVGVLQVAKVEIPNPSALLMFLGRIAVQETEWVAGLIAAATLISMAPRSESWHPRNWRIIQGGFRLVAAWPKPASAAAFAAVAFLILGLLYS